MNTTQENVLLTDKHMLVCIDTHVQQLSTCWHSEIQYIKQHFCGQVICCMNALIVSPDNILYLCGDITVIIKSINIDVKYYIIKHLSYNYDPSLDNIIEIGQIPINIHNAGVYFRKFFNISIDYFQAITSEHQFQNLTQSNKPGTSFRKGIYLSRVVQQEQDLRFNLLRCSTNLSGPTENFRPTDTFIVEKVNRIANQFFEKPVDLNHVLAQIYENTTRPKGNNKVEKKATIKAHSDKTKDMPRDGLIAFCTFYDTTDHIPTDALTQLRFRLKNPTTYPSLTHDFSVILYPNSVFLIPLSINRLYTHEIKPSALSVNKIPTRLGYVIRCSNTHAIFKDNHTYIIDKQGKEVKMEKITKQDTEQLVALYLQENKTDAIMDYGDIYFSMNDGDYQQPIV